MQPPLTCRKAGSPNPPDASGSNRAWLLDALRVAVHIRRGDVVTDNWHKRILKASYFINIAKTITDVSACSAGSQPTCCCLLCCVMAAVLITPASCRCVKMVHIYNTRGACYC